MLKVGYLWIVVNFRCFAVHSLLFIRFGNSLVVLIGFEVKQALHVDLFQAKKTVQFCRLKMPFFPYNIKFVELYIFWKNALFHQKQTFLGLFRRFPW